MDPITRRRLQTILAILVLAAAVILSYYSVEEVEVQASIPAADIALVIDVSGSMSGEKLESAKDAAVNFIRTVWGSGSTDIRIELIAFESEVHRISPLTYDSTTLESGISGLVADGYTAMGDALKMAVDDLNSNGRPGVPRYVLLMTDGISNADQFATPWEAAQLAAASGITVFTVGYGGDADTTLLQRIANLTGGRYYFASTGAELVGAFGSAAQTMLQLSATKHYGSRTLALLALPLAFFMPVVERTVTRTLVKTVLRREVPRVRAGLETPRFGGPREVPRVRPGYGYGPSQPQPPPASAPAPAPSPAPASAQTLPGGPQQGWVVCPRCGYANRPGARFCVRCGYRLA